MENVPLESIVYVAIVWRTYLKVVSDFLIYFEIDIKKPMCTM